MSGQLSDLFGNLGQGYVVAGLLLALAGAGGRGGTAAAGVALVAGFLVSGPLFVAYANPDLSLPVAHAVFARFYILPAIPVAILAGLGAYALLTALERLPPLGVLARAALPVVAALLLSVPAASAALHYANDDHRGDAVELNFVDDLLESLPPHAIFLSFSDEYWEGMTYAQVVDRTRTDVTSSTPRCSVSASTPCRCASRIRPSSCRSGRTTPPPTTTG